MNTSTNTPQNRLQNTANWDEFLSNLVRGPKINFELDDLKHEVDHPFFKGYTTKKRQKKLARLQELRSEKTIVERILQKYFSGTVVLHDF